MTGLAALLGRLATVLDGLLPRAARWLVHREPLWLVTGAGVVLDVAARLAPMVPDGWHPWVDAVVVLLTVVSGRAIVSSPATVAKLKTSKDAAVRTAVRAHRT